MNRIYVGLCISCFLAFLWGTACRRDPEVYPYTTNLHLQGLLKSNDNCYAPCWMNLVPGQSTEDDYYNLVKSFDPNRFTFHYQESMARGGNSIMSYAWNDNLTDSIIYLHFENSQLQSIGTYIDSADVKMVFHNLGEPSHSLLDYFSGIDSSGYGYELFWEDLGVVAILESDISGQFSCRPGFRLNQKVRWITFVKPNSSRIMLEDTIGKLFAESNDGSLQEWHDNELLPPCNS